MSRTLYLLFFLLVAAILIIIANPGTKTLPPTENPQDLEKIRALTRQITEHCQEQTTDQAPCYQNEVSSKLLNVYPTEQILEAIYDYDVYFSCHAFTHFIGQALYLKLGNIADAYSQVNFTCHGGAYHGVMEAFLNQRKTTIDRISGPTLEQVCQDSPKKVNKNPSQIFTECLHGFGHAFMFITDSNLSTSLTYCDKLDPQYQERCWGGAFMENSTSSTKADHPTKWLKTDDKFYPCTILENRYLKQCYFFQANYLLKITNRDYVQVFNDCGQLKDQGSHDYCVLGLGAQLASVSNEHGVDAAAGVCPLAPDKNDAHVCVEGAIPSLFARYGGDAPQIFEFCRQIAPFLRQFCFAKLGHVAKTYWEYPRQGLENICNNAGEFKEACLEGQGISFQY